MIWRLAPSLWPGLRAIIAAHYAGETWPREYAAADLEWCRAEEASGRARIPGRPTLMKRWGMTDHAVKTLLTPPADRQPTASRDYGEPRESAENRQPAASRAPTDRSIDPHLSQEEDQKEELIDHAAAPLALFEPPTSAEGRRFLAVLRRWSSGPVAPADRWRVDLAADLAWFNEEVLADPELVALNIGDALNRWNDWLETQYRDKAAGRTSKYPRNWKTSLRNALRFAGANQRPPTPRTGATDHGRNAPRGAFDGAAQRFDVPIVTGGTGEDGHLDGWDDAI